MRMTLILRMRMTLILRIEDDTDSKFEDYTDCIAVEVMESKLEYDTDLRFEYDTDLRFEYDTDCMKEEVMESKLEEITESKLEEITESKLEEITESKLEEITESKLEEITESKLEEITESKLEEIAERKLEEITESKLEKITESKLEEITESKLEEITESKLEKEMESKLHEDHDCKVEEDKKRKLEVEIEDRFADHTDFKVKEDIENKVEEDIKCNFEIHIECQEEEDIQCKVENVAGIKMEVAELEKRFVENKQQDTENQELNGHTDIESNTGMGSKVEVKEDGERITSDNTPTSVVLYFDDKDSELHTEGNNKSMACANQERNTHLNMELDRHECTKKGNIESYIVLYVIDDIEDDKQICSGEKIKTDDCRNIKTDSEADRDLYTERIIQSEIKTHIAEYAEEDSELNTDPYMFEKLVIVKDGNEKRNTDIPVEVDTDLYTERIIQSEIKTHIAEYGEEDSELNTDMFEKLVIVKDGNEKRNTDIPVEVDTDLYTERIIQSEIKTHIAEYGEEDSELNTDPYMFEKLVIVKDGNEERNADIPMEADIGLYTETVQSEIKTHIAEYAEEDSELNTDPYMFEKLVIVKDGNEERNADIHMEADIGLYTETVIQSEIKTLIAEYGEENSELNTDPYMFEKLVIVKDGNEERNADIPMEADIGLYTETVIQSEIKTHIAEYAEEDSELNTDPYMFEKLVIVKDGNEERNADIHMEADIGLYTETVEIKTHIQSEIKTHMTMEYGEEDSELNTDPYMFEKLVIVKDGNEERNTDIPREADIGLYTETVIQSEIKTHIAEYAEEDSELNTDMFEKLVIVKDGNEERNADIPMEADIGLYTETVIQSEIKTHIAEYAEEDSELNTDPYMFEKLVIVKDGNEERNADIHMEADIGLYTETVIQSEIKTHMTEYGEEDSELNTDPYMFEKLVIVKDGNEERNADIHMEADIGLYTETVLQSEIKTHIAEYGEEDSELNTDPYMFEKLVIVKDGNEERNTDIPMEADIGLYTETVIQSEIKTHIAEYAEEDSELNTESIYV